MKSILAILLVVCTGFGFSNMPPDSTTTIFQKGTAQFLIAEGKRMYNEGNYRISLVKFREALSKDKGNAEATYWLGECHLALGNYEKAKGYIEEALSKQKDVNEEAHFLLATCQHRMNLLDEAIKNYTVSLGTLSEIKAKKMNVTFHLEECKRAKKMIANPVKVKITGLPSQINTAFEETAPVLSPDGKAFYFVSRRADNKGGGISPGDERYFEDIYVSIWNDTTNAWETATNDAQLIRRINTKGMDAISQISADGKTLYLTINTMVMKSPKPKTKHSDIFYCRKNNRGTWNSPKALGKPINSIYFDAAPSFTADGETVYFVSERLGGKGRADIYVSYKEGRKWSKPENLGDSINTSGNETTVFISPDEKYLFFSSTGHEGMGGYDVYVSKHDGESWSKPVNLGYPINTVADETHFVYYPQLKRAYYAKFSSPENKGKGARDLFEIDMQEFPLP